MLLSLKKTSPRRNTAVDGRAAADTGKPAVAGLAPDVPEEPLAEVIELPVARRERPGRRGRVLAGSDAGMATAEYAIATLAAVGFAGLLVLIMRSGEVRGLLMNIIEQALSAV
jgi:hypothetical protein